MSLNTYSPLLTDLYQLTMAYGYWKLNMHEQEAAFHLIYRKNPFKGRYAVACGLASVVDYLSNFHFKADDLDYLSTLKSANGEALFPNDFLAYLGTLRFSCHIDAIPEGTIVFPQLPLLRVEGPILQCQLIETPLLNMINFQTLVATKATRVCLAAEGDPVIEFGLRRAQGPDGGLSASRAAYIGGCVATSNTLAGKLYDIPVRGTHAHSWVTAFPSEKEAFAAYAKVMPHNGVFLVDTYDTLQGVQHAIDIGRQLRAEGAELLGIRLDSGDMAELSIQARKLLDDAGFEQTDILASNTLDEYVIADLKRKGAKISSWGVGTHLATAYDQPALDGVYKLSAIKEKNDTLSYRLKLSEQQIKISNPGRLQVRRYFVNEQFVKDIIFDIDNGIDEIPQDVLIDSSMTHLTLNDYDAFVDLLEPVLRNGKLVQNQKSIHDIREELIDQVKTFHARELEDDYPVGLEKKLHDLKQSLIESVKA